MKKNKTFEKFERMENIASEDGWISDFSDDIIFLNLKDVLRDGKDSMTLKEFVDKIEERFNEEYYE